MVGESGSNKSTLARLVMALDTPTAGRVELLPRPATTPVARAIARRARLPDGVPDPYGSLDPRRTVRRTIVTELAAAGAGQRHKGRAARARRQVLAQVGLRAGDAHKYPHDFSAASASASPSPAPDHARRA